MLALPESFAELWEDDRAVEGLPVRLVIALVVGVACLSVMLHMVQGVGTLAVSEVDAKPDPGVVTPGTRSVTVAVVDADGDPVSGATVVVTDGTADVEGVATATTGAAGRAKLSLTTSLGPNQERGTLRIDVRPPAAGDYADRRANARILVVAEG